MNIYLGNITFGQVREKLGYQLTDEDKVLWDKYHNEQADLSGMESSFHVFEIPLSIRFKGNAAKEAILAMFTNDKFVEPKGRIHVGEVE